MTIRALPQTKEGLDNTWSQLGLPGTWWTGAQRIAMAAETRAARACPLCRSRKKALSPYSIDENHPASEGLSAEVRDAVHRLSTDPGRVSERWYLDLLEAGQEPEAVVELVGVVSIVCLADTLARGLGEPERDLPVPTAGDPRRERTPGLEISCAWVPTVAPERAEGIVKDFYDYAKTQGGFAFHVARALTAVPPTALQFFGAFSPNYAIAGETAGDLTRPQVELLASATSSENECFY
jgi:hypothetical protein